MSRSSDPEASFRDRSGGVRCAQVLMSCETLEPTLGFFIGRLGFRVDAIYPADDPTTAEISGHGLGIRLVRGMSGGVSVVYLRVRRPQGNRRRRHLAARAQWRERGTGRGEPQTAAPATKQSLALTRASGEVFLEDGPRRHALSGFAARTPRRRASSPRISAFWKADRCPITCTFTGSGSRPSSAARAGRAWCTKARANPSCSRPATACCSRR